MKKLLALLLAALLACSVAFATEETEEVSPYRPIHISLWGNPASGYEWSCEFENNGVLEAPMSEYVEATENGGTYEYYFGVRGAGRAQIIFNYGISWGMSAPEQSIVCNVIVDEDGRAQVRWAAMYAGDNTIMVRLPGNPTTGWDWNYVNEPNGMVSLTSESYQAYDASLEGAGGEITYLFHVEKPGETVLVFNYANMWDPYAAADESYCVALNVNEEMEISMTIES